MPVVPIGKPHRKAIREISIRFFLKLLREPRAGQILIAFRGDRR
jgi:hypothetical protein